MFSLGNGAQYGLTIIECDLIFYAMVLPDKYTLLMSQKQILLSSCKRSSSNTCKGLFAFLVLVGSLFSFCVKCYI